MTGPAAYAGYLDSLTEADEYAAIDIALDLVDRGVPAERVLLDLVAPAQVEVGERWARNEWSVDATVSDLGYMVDFLAAALYVDDGSLFTEFVQWLLPVLTSRRVPAEVLGWTLEHYGRMLHDFPRAARYLDRSRSLVGTAGAPTG
ncbi:B12-binding domain-containing protein [Micromonospora sp. URMC 103]|uniref:B12-binding domain-containing protein n=1 Tax=Micromonospora sp. URMC 103 TaxID=3423406 RepID=UPI003F19E018